MTEQFRRAWRLQVGTRRIDSGVSAFPLRIAFSVERDETKFPNNCEIAIWNLASDTRNELDRFEGGISTNLEAGYLEAMGSIFLGNLRHVEHARDGADIVTRVSAGDGEKETSAKKIAKTFAKGTALNTVLKELVSALGVPPGNLDRVGSLKTATGSTKLNRALSFAGPTADALASFCASFGLVWTVQDGALLFRTQGVPVDNESPLLSPESGLIGSPKLSRASENSKDGSVKKGDTIISCTSLIVPSLIPGRGFAVKSEFASGNFVALKTKHYGDSHGKDWCVDVDGQELKSPNMPAFVGL